MYTLQKGTFKMVKTTLTKQFIRMNPYFIFYSKDTKMTLASRAEIKRAYLYILLEEEWGQFISELKKEVESNTNIKLDQENSKLQQMILRIISCYYFREFVEIGLTELTDDIFVVDTPFLNIVYQNLSLRESAVENNDETVHYRLELIHTLNELMDPNCCLENPKTLYNIALNVGKVFYNLLESLGFMNNGWVITLDFEASKSEKVYSIEVETGALMYAFPTILEEHLFAPYFRKMWLAHCLLGLKTKIDMLSIEFQDAYLWLLQDKLIYGGDPNKPKKFEISNFIKEIDLSNSEVDFSDERKNKFYNRYLALVSEMVYLVYNINADLNKTELEVLSLIRDSHFEFQESYYGVNQAKTLNWYRRLILGENNSNFVMLLENLVADFKNILYWNGFADKVWQF